MLNRFAKFLLAATSMSPILGAIAVSQYSQGKSWESWTPWLVVAACLALICWGVLSYAAKYAQSEEVTIKEFERHDKEVLAFLIAYLLPFISADSMTLNGDWLTVGYIFAIIFLVITHAGAFHFNPVMGFLGYHFYAIRNENNAPCLLITRQDLENLNVDITTAKLSVGIYLDKGSSNA
jgi:MFS family permease